MEQSMLRAWERFTEGRPPGEGVSKIIVESWERCQAFQVDTARANLKRISFTALTELLARHAPLISAAKPHLRWALAAMEPLHPVIIILASPEGIVLDSVGNDPDAMAAFGLIPGYDWSERAMGSNGIGTALAFGSPVAVVGEEHYTQTWHNNTCVGAPIRSADGTLLGAVDISTTAADGDPARLVLVSFLAQLIARELEELQIEPETFASTDVLSRAAAAGSSAGPAELQRHARELAEIAEDLRAAACMETVPFGLPRESVDVIELLDRVRRGVEGTVFHGSTPTSLTLSGDVSRLEHALVLLAKLARRRGSPPVVLSVVQDAHSVEIRIQAAAQTTPDRNVRWNVHQSGVLLGQWIARELLGALGGTLVIAADACEYTLKFELQRQ